MYYQEIQIIPFLGDKDKYGVTIIVNDMQERDRIGPINLVFNDTLVRSATVDFIFDLRNAVRSIKRLFDVKEIKTDYDREHKKYKIVRYKREIPIV